MKQIIFLLFLTAGIFTVKADDIQTIKQNYKQYILSENKEERDLIDVLIKTPKEEYFSDQMVVELMDRYPLETKEVQNLLNTFRADGSWVDINYQDNNRSGWQPKKHVERILVLAKAYSAKQSSFHRSAEVKRSIHKAIKYWFGAKLISPNWWYNQIGIPKTMGAIIILLENELKQDEKTKILEYMENAKFGMTGQNKVWLAGNVLVRALIQNDIELVGAARDTIFSEIKTGNTEGIKEDNSFHQHGAQLQFGNYGAAYISSMGFWSQVLDGTSFALQQPQLDILSRLINDGYRQVLWKGNMDISSLGRQLFHNSQKDKAFSVGFSSIHLSQADNVNSSQYIDLLNENFYHKSQPSQLTGLYHFWMSDYTIQRRPHWMASVKMSSPRVVGGEAGNGDNLKGYYMADGAMYTYINGTEYENIFPCWDWRKIPGVTSYETNSPMKQLDWGGYHNQNTFVGNVNNGKTGITSMFLNRDGLKARKSWIFTEDYILCIGSGIEADSGYVVTTSIEQRIKKTNLLQLKNNRWVKTNSAILEGEDARFFHDKTGYIVLNPEGGKAVVEHRNGNWKDIMNMYPSDFASSKEVFSLWIDHGKDPKNGSYKYIVMPATSPRQVKHFNTQQIQILKNNSRIQSVTIGKINYVAAYPLADLNVLDGVRFQSTNTGLFMIEQEENRIKVIVVDPTQTQEEMNVTIKGQTKTVKLPTGDKKGTPTTVYFDL